MEVEFDLSIQIYRTHLKVRGQRGRLALGRGPLVYCLESTDNPGFDIINPNLDPASLQPVWDEGLLGGIIKIEARTREGNPLTFIPYHLWANRGESQMNVFVYENSHE